MPNSGSISGRTSFEPHHGKGPTGWHIDLKPGQAAGRRFGSQPIGPLKRYDQRRNASRKQLGVICTQPSGKIRNDAAEQNGGSVRLGRSEG
jgi:hypothetical protein